MADLSTHGVVAVIRNDQDKFLLLEDNRELMMGHWAPPHGRCESTDSSEEDGVKREVLEEIGLLSNPVKVLLRQAADTKVTTVSFWLTELESGEIVLDESESSRYGWFTIDEALELKLYPGTKLFFEQLRAGQITL